MPRIYDLQDWRDLPRTGECAGIPLFGGECHGSAHLHHISQDSEEELLLLCQRHHALLHGARNRARRWKECPHKHRTLEARFLCERRLNAA